MLNIVERNGYLWLDGVIDGRRVRKSTRLKKGQEDLAKDVRDQVLKDVLSNKKVGPTVEVGVRDYLAGQGVGETSTRYCLAFAKQFGGRIGELDMAKVHHHYMRRGVMPETIRREINAVQAMLNWNSEMHNMGVRFKIKRPRAGEDRVRYLEVDEVRALLEHAVPWFKPYLICLLYTGVRRAEGVKLTGRDVTPRGLLVKTRKGKGGKVRWRTIPIHPELAKVMPDAEDDEPVFRTKFGNPLDLNNVTKEFRKTARKAGVEDVTLHDTRRTFASSLLKEGVDLRTIADLLGHTTLNKLMLYAQVMGVSKNESVTKLSY